ncbi:unnamed protein product, partial [Mesorhabditis spiculigera]
MKGQAEQNLEFLFAVHPSELERIVRSIDGVSDCVVVGIEHETKGEVPHALVVKGKQGINDCKIMALTNGQLPRHKQLGGVTFIRVIPRSLDGEVSRSLLKQLYFGPGNQLRAKI